MPEQTANPIATAPAPEEAPHRAAWRAMLLAEGFHPPALTDEVLDLAALLRFHLDTDDQVVRAFAQLGEPQLKAALGELPDVTPAAAIQEGGAIHALLIAARKHTPAREAAGAAITPPQAQPAAAAQAPDASPTAAPRPPPELPQSTAAIVRVAHRLRQRIEVLRQPLARIAAGEVIVSDRVRQAVYEALAEDARLGGPAAPPDPAPGKLMRGDVTVRMQARLGWRDRAKVLIGGKIEVEIKADTQHDPGAIGPVTRGIVVRLPGWPRPPRWTLTLDPK